jgi:glycosyltransferase involved in cell wall biosynthesis
MLFHSILHTEASLGWGGQEIRVLQEILGLQNRGWQVMLACDPESVLFKKALEHNIALIPIRWSYKNSFNIIRKLVRTAQECNIQIFNTHSSLDSWLGSIAARLAKCAVVRTRHLSTPIKGGLNARILYRWLADAVVCTSQAAKFKLIDLIGPGHKVECIATGVNEKSLLQGDQDAQVTRSLLKVESHQIAVGTACVLRSWKGIEEFLAAADTFKNNPDIKFFVFGGGSGLNYYENLYKTRYSKANVIFTGHLENITSSIMALDIFCLLSTAHEGISQASLQASYLQKPLITTTVGGLPEVCIDQVTGLLVEPKQSAQVVNALQKLIESPELRVKLGLKGHQKVKEQFTFDQTLDQMEAVFRSVARKV